MRIRLACPHCGTDFTVAAAHAGKTGRCPNGACRGRVKVPASVAPSKSRAGSTTKETAATSGLTPVHWTAAAAAAVLLPVAGWVLFAGGGDAPVAVADDDSVARPAPAQVPATPGDSAPPGGSAAASLLSGGGGPPAAVPVVNRRVANRNTAVSAEARPGLSFERDIAPFVTKYCADCHGPDYSEGDLDFSRFDDAEDLRTHRGPWERVLGILKVGAMPPSEAEQPSAEERAAAIAWIDRALNEVDCSIVNDPGRVTVRRLNRVEYDNAVRDLFGMNLHPRPSGDFPSDDVGNGFDNQGEVLTLPPLLMEKYLDAAERVAGEVIVGDPMSLLVTREDGKTLAQSGEFGREFDFPADGTYEIRVNVEADQAGPEKARMLVALDKQLLDTEIIREHRRADTWTMSLRVPAGKHRVRVNFPNDFYDEKARKDRRDRNLIVNWIEVAGPEGGRPDDLPASHTRLITAVPRGRGNVADAAAAVLRPLATRAFRRPATDLEVARLANLVKSTVDGGRTFEQGVQLGVQAVLVSPHFLFRVESVPEAAAPGEVASLGDYELASRLSFFLWSSLPDDRLLELAGGGKLSDPAVLRGEVDRMLDDPKSDALLSGFFGQWLNLRNLEPDSFDGREFRLWSGLTRDALLKETELFCREVVREDRDVRTFLTADYTYVNPRLAEYYGLAWDGKSGDALEKWYLDNLPDFRKGKRGREKNRRAYPFPQEDEFRRVPLPPGRRGVLTQGSVLALTSNPTATSPVKRGKWILDNILGTPPPPPPPNVPALEATQEADENLSLREALAKHREDPGCASCHAVMDPLGFAFENFDAIGRWREKDGGHGVDASGELPDGSTFTGAVELADVLADRSDEFTAHFTRRLMTYGLGRGLQWYDRCAVDAVVEQARGDDFRFRSLVVGIVTSDPFLKRRVGEPADIASMN